MPLNFLSKLFSRNKPETGKPRDPLDYSKSDPISKQWMWLFDEIAYVTKRFPMFSDKRKDMFYADKIIAIFRIIDPERHPENLVRGGYKGLVESSRGDDEKSGIVYAVGIALTYWRIYKEDTVLADKFHQQSMDDPSAFGMVLAYVFVYVQEYVSSP